jgi:putative membrane protein
MNPVALLFATIAGLLHVVIFAMESLLILRPTVWRRFLLTSQAEAQAVHPWALNQGFYNLFLAAGALGGVIASLAGSDAPATAIVAFSCGCMAAAGVVLIATDRRMVRAAIIQAGPPLVALIALAVG